MPNLAQQIAAVDDQPQPTRRGPANCCYPLYGAGTLEDWQAIEDKRDAGYSWRDVQALVDRVAGVDKPLPLEKFRYHWRRRCYCWPEDLRR